MEDIANVNLLSRIRQVCRLDDRPLWVRLREFFGDSDGVSDLEPYETPPQDSAPPRATSKEPLQILKSSPPLRAFSREEFEAYVDKLQNLRDIQAFLDRYRERQAEPLIKMVRKIPEHIQKKSVPAFEPDEDNAELLAEYVLKHVLGHQIGKISEALFRTWCENRQTPEVRDLTQALNMYLERLGVYTLIAEVGESFSKVSDYYDTLKYQESQNVADEIERVDRPAYILEYIDMAGTLQKVILPGKCLLKVRD